MSTLLPPALVTGASGGIGAAAALALAQKGHPVALCCHQNRQTAEAICQSLLQEGRAAVLCQGDVRSRAGVDALFEEAEAALGPIGVLVNCAGQAQQKMFCDISGEDWDDMFALHARGSYLCCQRALPAMLRKKEGSIINISSMWGQVGASCEVHYSAAKAAVIGLTKALAKELGPSGIRVNCVAPGAIETPMLAGLDDAALHALCEETPLGRLGQAKEVAAAICFLASQEAAFLTGQVLCPNGGFVV